ncbi:MAG TPA: hypothetical protein VKA84_24930 [Gemmatimonadaceae bacterium]|nr:hypothetical protein [Gemmatimonadaceae bacterium]
MIGRRRHHLPATLGALGALGAAAFAACGGGTEPGPARPARLELSVSGYVERSGVVTLGAKRDTADVPAGELTFAAVPAAAVQFQGGGTAKLLSTGAVSIIARASDGQADTVALDVKAPPTIVFDRVAVIRDTANRDIYRVALDGQDLVRLTTHLDDDQRPTVAAGTVVFARFTGTRSDLYAVPLAGGAERRVTDTPTFDENAPALSPNGQRLAYTRSDAAVGLPRLWLSDAGGAGAAAAATGITAAGAVDATPRWSPTGDRLLFVSTAAAGTAQLYVLPAAGGTASLLDVGPGPNVEPAWSADGGAVAFTSARQSGVGLYRATVATPAAAVWLAAGQAGEAVWLPDGRLVYTDYGAGSVPRLRWIDPADPSAVHEIDTGSGAAAHPAVVPAP